MEALPLLLTIAGAARVAALLVRFIVWIDTPRPRYPAGK